MDDQSLEPYFKLLGKFSYNWGSMEMALTTANFLIYHKLGGEQKIKEGLPKTQFRRQVCYFRLALKKLHILAEMRAEGADLLAKAHALSKDRHLFTHGVAYDFPAPQTVRIWFPEISEVLPMVDRGRTVTWTELEAMGEKASGYANRMLDLTHRVMKLVE